MIFTSTPLFGLRGGSSPSLQTHQFLDPRGQSGDSVVDFTDERTPDKLIGLVA